MLLIAGLLVYLTPAQNLRRLERLIPGTRKYKEKQEERDGERDTIVKRARARMAKRDVSISHSLGAIDTGKVNWLYGIMKGIRGICG